MPELVTLSDGRPATVGVCEDDHVLREVLRRSLADEGYAARCTASGREAIVAFTANAPHVLILDISLADGDGRDVCAALRERGVDVPVLFLTARHDLDDRLAAFHAGGDDYLTKPFELPELLVRVRGLLRRAPPSEAPDELRLDPAAHAVVLDGQPVALTRTEFRLLAALMGARPAVVHRSVLAAAAWPSTSEPSANTLDTCVARVRAKLRRAGAGMSITTVRGVGYALR